MAHLIKQINIELTIKLMAGAILIASLIATGANAIDSGVEAEDRTHLEHKLWLDENTNGDHDDDMTPEEYESSQKALVIADANERLARIKAEAYGRQS